MNRRWILLALLICSAPPLTAQHPLDRYVEQGLTQNLGLRQQQLAVERSRAAVRQARGLFLPSATVNARYSKVSGSVVDLGSLINPAFGALNQILQEPRFPTDIDLRLPLRQETTLRIAQPLFQPAIFAGYRAAKASEEAQGASRDAAVRETAAAIRSAWLQHAKTRRLVELRAATRVTINELYRVTERLIANGRATPDALYRVRAQRSEAEQLEAESVQLADATRESFNLLLGRPLTDSVELGADSTFQLGALPTLGDAIASGARGREELQALGFAQRAGRAQRRAVQSSFLPSLSFALDYGVQGNEYRFARDADFTTLSLVASWNLFNGGQDAARAEQVALDVRRLGLQQEEVQRGVELQIRTAWQAAAVARMAITSAEDQATAARRSFELVKRRTEEGLASPLELSEARTTLTAAELNRLFTTYDYYLRRVELDRAAALYPRTTP